MTVHQIEVPPRVKWVSLEIRAGEILGVAGLVGSGRTELLRAIFGANRACGGYLEFPHGNIRPLFTSPHEAVRNGVVMISEDRKADGLLVSESIAANIQLPKLGIERFGSWRSYNARRARKIAEDYRSQLLIRCQTVDQPVGKLSGGNQQKVVLAKWLHRGGKIFLFDEPTRGIDIAARELVYQVIRQLAAEGKGVLVVSSDLEELLGLCQRIGVMSNGKWVATFEGPTYDAQQIVRSMFLGYDAPDPSGNSPT
jgi:ribose transport system ATP-binding protein